MHAIDNTVSENARTQTAELLNRHLAAVVDLNGQLKQAHWNVRGPTFMAVHELFDRVAEEAESYSDLLAERAASAQLPTARSRSRRSAPSSSPIRCASPTKRKHIRGCSELAAFGQSAAKRSDSGRPSATTPMRPIFSLRYGAVPTISSGSSNARRAEMNGTADFANARPDNPNGSAKIATAPIQPNSATPGSEADVVGSGSLDNVAIWVNEGGAGGEVIR